MLETVACILDADAGVKSGNPRPRHLAPGRTGTDGGCVLKPTKRSDTPDPLAYGKAHTVVTRRESQAVQCEAVNAGAPWS